MTSDSSLPSDINQTLDDRPVSKASSKNLSRETLYGVLVVVVLGLIGWLYYRVIDTQILGFTHDDGVYAVTGKALAEGKGFTLLHVVGQPPEIKYPFIYPAILALVWLVNPHFPQNLPALNEITIAFTLAACGLTYLYLRQAHKFPGWLALIILLLTTCHFFFIYFFSSVMSEGPFLFFSLLTLWVAYQTARTDAEGKLQEISRPALWTLVALSCVTFLTRIPGIALMAAIGTWLLINGQWKNAIRYGMGCFAFGVMPWLLWVKFQTPTVTTMNYPLLNAYSNYGLEFFHNFTGTNYLSSLPGDFRTLFSALLEQLFPIIPNFLKRYPNYSHYPHAPEISILIILIGQYLAFGYFVLQMVHTVLQSLKKTASSKRGRFSLSFNPGAFSIPGLYLFFYLVMITLWNYEDQLSRFLTAVSPLLWLYFFKPWVSFLPEFGCRWPIRKIKASLALIGVLISATLSLWIFPSSYGTIFTSRNQHWVDSGRYRWMWGEYQQTFDWINHNLPPKAPLAASSDVVFYLYTNHPAYYTFFASLRRKNGKFTAESIPLLMESLDYYHIQYLVAEPHMTARVIRRPMNQIAEQLITVFPQRFQKIYASPRSAIVIFKILPAKPQPQ